MDLISQFNKYSTGDNESLIRKALTSATSVGEGLIPQSLEKEISNTIIRLSPELALVQKKKISGKYHEFNQLTSLPSSRSAIGENATTPITQSATTRTGVNLKVIRRKGAVTNFLQDTSGDFIDATAYEMENHLIAHIYDMVNYILYGNASANAYEFSGLDTFITTNRVQGEQYGDTPTSLKFLNDMIDASNRKGGAKHNRVFVMSPEMLSKVSELLTNVRLNQGLTGSGITQIEVNGGWRLNAYRDIPIIESTSTRPQATMGTVAGATATSGGTIADATTVNFAVAPVTLNGEEMPYRVTQVGGSSANTNTITISFTAFSGAFRYKVYTGTVGSETLKCIVSAQCYDANGTPTGNTNSITFTTSPNSANPSGTYTDGVTTTALATTTTVTATQSDIPLEQDTGHSPAEVVFLWDLDPIQGLGKLVYTNTGGSNYEGLVTTESLNKVDDYLQFLIKSYPALTPSFEATSYLYRGLRVS